MIEPEVALFLYPFEKCAKINPNRPLGRSKPKDRRESGITRNDSTDPYACNTNLKTGKTKARRFFTLENICKELDCQPGDILEYRGNIG